MFSLLSYNHLQAPHKRQPVLSVLVFRTQQMAFCFRSQEKQTNHESSKAQTSRTPE